MIHTDPPFADLPVRVLFVLATLDATPEVADLRRLARRLDPGRFRVEALPCLATPGHAVQAARLRAAGVAVDGTALDLGFEDTVRYLERRLARCDVVVSCQDVADIYPALDRMRHRPPLIEYGTTPDQAAAGPKHLTARYVGATEAVRRVAAARMPGRTQDARAVPPGRAAAALFWQALFEEVLAGRHAAPPTLFRSIMQGGFECSTHRLGNGRRLDVIAATGHDVHAESDYAQLGRMGMRTLRDGLRWHLVEGAPGRFDFASFRPMLRAAQATGAQVIWDLLHYGWPDDIDIWTPAFVDRFAAFARAAALVHRETTDEVPFWCPVNEISFFSWGAGDVRYLNPFAAGRGFELKVQLARASIAAMQALREVDPRARFVHCEPLIAVHHDPATGRPRWEAEGWHDAQFQVFDLLAGRIWPQIGGDPSFLDILGANYYSHNQWIHGGPPLPVGHPRYRPLSDLLFEAHARYGRPLSITETGIEGDRRAAWLRYVAGEVARARGRGIPVEGICLYPVMNHPGWDDDRPCPNGLLTQHFEGAERGVEPALAAEVARVVRSHADPVPPHQTVAAG